MSISVSDLNNLLPSQPVDLGALAPSRPRFPRAGRYILQVPEGLTFEDTFSQTQAGYLAAEINPTIVGPSSEGYEVRYVKVSAKDYQQKDFRDPSKVTTTSQMAQLASACGITGTFPGEPDQQVNIILQTAGRQFEAVLDWKAYNKRTGVETLGMANFPTDDVGNPLPYIVDEDDKDPGGNAVRYRARIFVKRFISSR